VEELEKFRAETREWLEANCPESMRTPITSDADSVWGGRRARYDNPDAKLWLERMGAKGWTTPIWPAEYGGGGLSGQEDGILQEELRRIHARPALQSFGIWMLGPVLLEYGNEEQKHEHLPKIIRGEIRWCQGYSEPGSGSDLASLQTRALLDGDEYVVNGSKIWTSYADSSDWIFCLVRTDTDVPKHDGISFLLFDMAVEGVTVSPIKLISGSSPFCQTFFSDVRVPAKNLVGKPGQGWTIAKALLQHERSMIAGMGSGTSRSGGRAKTMGEIAKDYVGQEGGRVADAVLRDRIAQQELDALCFGLTAKRSTDSAKAGQGPGHVASLFKYYGTELNKRRCELMMSIMGADALGWEGEGFDESELAMTREWLRSKGNSIEGGTSEIQLNVIAKRVLGLAD
jgi:alkylation response protein AidB-like acyl-CoA dehydrogenase